MTDTGHDHPHARPHDHEGEVWWRRALHAIRPHGHDAADAILTAEEASREGIRAAWISMAGMAATALAQIVIVALSGSIALLADTLHNLGHLVTTIPLVIAFRIGRRQPTRRYTFGYRRAEDLVGLLIAGVIALSAGLIIWESVSALRDPAPLTNLGWVFAAGLVGAAGNEVVAVYRIRIGRRIGSAALIAEGNHARADGLTSIAVAVGAVGVWLGFARADAIIGLLIAGAILWILVDSSRSLLRRLMDGVDPALIDDIERVAGTVPGVTAVEEIRARWSGHRLEAQLTLGVDGDLTVAQAHDLTVAAHHTLAGTVPHLSGVAIHLHPARTPADTEDDAAQRP
ncbi:MAG TPA: cation diffusion facilitator family transporter [Egicoccus sp.]|nr:cation diffusion facilitator family transporter [Egicoccus sp.]HSK24385.1 cation diffusion facilitator family transporter [Egicoccus sp.]